MEGRAISVVAGTRPWKAEQHLGVKPSHMRLGELREAEGSSPVLHGVDVHEGAEVRVEGP
jgi:hypothetical protein